MRFLKLTNVDREAVWVNPDRIRWFKRTSAGRTFLQFEDNQMTVLEQIEEWLVVVEPSETKEGRVA
jgi:hypothetical protein